MCKVLKAQALDLFFALHNLSAARQLPSANGRGTLRNNLLQSIPLAASEDFDVKSVNPLFRKVLNNNPEDAKASISTTALSLSAKTRYLASQISTYTLRSFINIILMRLRVT